MEFLLLMPLLLLLFSAIMITIPYHKNMVKKKNRFAILWSILIFCSVCVLGWLALYYGLYIHFTRQ